MGGVLKSHSYLEGFCFVHGVNLVPRRSICKRFLQLFLSV
jgi:hypothetical protein